MKDISLIAIDWGTTNRRGWALAKDGRIIDERADGSGLLSIARGEFGSSFTQFTSLWRSAASEVPTLMCGMVGSKLGWVEAPYLSVPADLLDLARHLCPVPNTPRAYIVPGLSIDTGEVPDVMRGEECQVLGALAARNITDAVIVLPGTHSKWVIVERSRLVRFRTYMTGEAFNLFSSSGTIAQLIEKGDPDPQAFAQGLARGRACGGALLHALFGARTLSLFDRLPRTSLASHLSGLLVGAEFADALTWAGDIAQRQPILAIGSPALLASYTEAARAFAVTLDCRESAAVLPRALWALAGQAGLA